MKVFVFYRPGTTRSLHFYNPNLGHKDQTKLAGGISFREKDKRQQRAPGGFRFVPRGKATIFFQPEQNAGL